MPPLGKAASPGLQGFVCPRGFDTFLIRFRYPLGLPLQKLQRFLES